MDNANEKEEGSCVCVHRVVKEIESKKKQGLGKGKVHGGKKEEEKR